MTAAKLHIEAGLPPISVYSPFDGSLIGSIDTTDASDVDELIARARRGAELSRNLPRHKRATILEGAAQLIERRRDAFAETIVREAGKTIVQARKEVSRCVNTLKLSAEEAKRNAGEVIPFDAFAGSEQRQGWFTREPLGIITAITPYNDPLNLVAHKLGPAIAGGNAVLLKPSNLTPFSAVNLVDALFEAGLPDDVITIAHGDRELVTALISSHDARMVSFTGGFATGEAISREEAHEVLEPLDFVVIGDPDHCVKKIGGYEAIGADRMMCMMQFGSIPHAAVLKSLELAGRHLLPAFTGAKPEAVA